MSQDAPAKEARRRVRRRRFAVTLFFLSLSSAMTSGCATTDSGPTYRPSETPVREIPVSQAEAVMAKDVPAYGPGTGEPASMHDAFTMALKPADVARVQYDPALDDVAQVMAAMVAERNQLGGKDIGTLVVLAVWRAASSAGGQSGRGHRRGRGVLSG